MEKTTLLILISVLSTFIVLALMSRLSSNKLFCNFLGWHLQPKKVSCDGASLGGNCPRCNKEVLQDSQGNWF